MNWETKFNDNWVSKISTVLCFLFVFAVAVHAQDRTAAGAYNEGLALLKEKNYEEGLTLLEEALTLATESENEKVMGLAKKNGSVAAYNAGNAKRKAEEHQAALDLYNKGIELNPANSSNYEGLARTYEAQGMLVEAVTSYVDAGVKGIEEGKDKRAQNRLKKAQNLVGKQYIAKNYDDAIALGTAFIELKDDNAEVQYYMSRSLAEKGSSEEALAHIEKAIMLTAESGTPDKYTFAKGDQLQNLGRNADAIAAFKMITEEKFKKQADYRIQKLQG